MTAPKPITIDPLSTSSLLVEVHAAGQSLVKATGFCVEAAARKFLVTNWHVVSGIHPDTGEVLSSSGSPPDELVIRHHASARLGEWVIKKQPLQMPSGANVWFEHPLGKAIDVIALPLNQDSDVAFHPLDLGLADFDMQVQVAMPVSIIGFPFGLATVGAWPIWKTSHIASEPHLNYEGRPAFLIDATTQGGMAGSPVVLRVYGGYATSKGSATGNGKPVTRFLGVYAGRIHGQAGIGRVWRPSVIKEILATVPGGP